MEPGLGARIVGAAWPAAPLARLAVGYETRFVGPERGGSMTGSTLARLAVGYGTRFGARRVGAAWPAAPPVA